MIIQMFELRCDDCRERFEDLQDFSLVSHSDVRANAKKRGWVRRKELSGFNAGELQDYCPQCKGRH